MSKPYNKPNYSGFQSSQKQTNQTTQPAALNPPLNSSANSPSNTPENSPSVQPEQMSLLAHQHIQEYLKAANKTSLDKEDLNAVLRLSQHLRVFGLLSAVGYVNQSNAQENNETRKRTVPVWSLLLGHLLGKVIDPKNAQQRRELMGIAVDLAKDKPGEYLAAWSKSLLLAKQWNFWARAYSEGE